MKGTIITLQATGGVKEQTVITADVWRHVKDAIGGHLEIVPYFNKFLDSRVNEHVHCVAFCNEEGKLNGHEMNILATVMWHDVAPQMKHDYLVGDIAIVYGDEEFMENL
jgi:hypothetical protein